MDTKLPMITEVKIVETNLYEEPMIPGSSSDVRRMALAFSSFSRLNEKDGSENIFQRLTMFIYTIY